MKTQQTNIALCLAAALIGVTTGSSSAITAPAAAPAAPALQWKYGSNDKNLANTTGSAKAGNAVPLATSYISTGYSPAQMATAYGFDKVPTKGEGATITIIAAYGAPNLQTDLNTFSTTYGITNTTVSVYYPNGKPATNNSAWAGEVTLDVEWAHALAPNAKINLVVAPDSSVGSLAAGISYANNTLKANIVSMSWGAAEFSGETALESLFTNTASTYIAASGDTGGVTQWPAVSRNVIGVGGTTMLYSTVTRTITNEVAWANGGGGVSRFITLPSYQVGFNVNSGKGAPDVSYNADPYTGVSVYYTDPAIGKGGWYVFGGTSQGAPQWAALVARRQSQALSNANLVATLYQSVKSLGWATFRDISSGATMYPAVKGYDLATGLGSPVVTALAGTTAPATNTTTVAVK